MIREYWYRAELMIRQSVVVFRQDKVKTRRWRLPPVVRAYARLRQGRAAAERSAANKAYSHSGKGSAPRERERELAAQSIGWGVTFSRADKWASLWPVVVHDD